MKLATLTTLEALELEMAKMGRAREEATLREVINALDQESNPTPDELRALIKRAHRPPEHRRDVATGD